MACGESGSLDLTTLDSDTTVCGEDEVKYQFLYAEKGFFDLAFVTQEGILTWIPSPCAKKSTGGVVFKVVCGCLSKIVTATIGRKSKCCGTVCAEGEVCDECVGCVSLTGDLAVNII